MQDFFGFGRVLERQDDALNDTVAPENEKAFPDSTSTAPSSQASTGRNLSGRLTPGRISPEEALSMCRNALAELAVESMVTATPEPTPVAEVERATVTVVSCECGCVRGRLEWGGAAPEDVAFTLLELGRGYTVVGEVATGPDTFKKANWRLKSVTGRMGGVRADSTRLRSGDRLLLEGPKWAMDRMLQKGGPSNSGAGLPTRGGSLPAGDPHDGFDQLPIIPTQAFPPASPSVSSSSFASPSNAIEVAAPLSSAFAVFRSNANASDGVATDACASQAAAVTPLCQTADVVPLWPPPACDHRACEVLERPEVVPALDLSELGRKSRPNVAPAVPPDPKGCAFGLVPCVIVTKSSAATALDEGTNSCCV